MTCFMSHNLAFMAHLVDLHLIFEKWNSKNLWSSSNLIFAGYTSSKIKFKIHQKWSKFIFWIPFFKNQVQINRGTVVNMKVHTDPKNSYMHPFVWQSITVRKSFFTLAKLFSHLIHTLGPWLLRFKKGLEYLCVSWVFLSLCVFFHTLATHGFTHAYLVHAYFCQI